VPSAVEAAVNSAFEFVKKLVHLRAVIKDAVDRADDPGGDNAKLRQNIISD
jgi:hypothetical protein